MIERILGTETARALAIRDVVFRALEGDRETARAGRIAAKVNRALGADSDDRAHVLRSDAAQRSDLIARR